MRPPDRGHAYGHGKAEHLAALAEAAILIVLALFVANEAVERLEGRDPGPRRHLVGAGRRHS